MAREYRALEWENKNFRIQLLSHKSIARNFGTESVTLIHQASTSNYPINSLESCIRTRTLIRFFFLMRCKQTLQWCVASQADLKRHAPLKSRLWHYFARIYLRPVQPLSFSRAHHSACRLLHRITRLLPLKSKYSQSAPALIARTTPDRAFSAHRLFWRTTHK